MSRIGRKDVMQLVKSAKGADRDTIKDLSQTDRKTLQLILGTLRGQPNISETEIDENKFASLKARLTGEGESPLPKEGLIKQIFLRITGGYVHTGNIEEELDDTYDKLYEYQPFSINHTTAERIQGAAYNTEVELRRLMDDPRGRKLDIEKKIDNAEKMLEEINKKESEWGTDAKIALFDVKKKLKSYIQELESPTLPSGLPVETLPKGLPVPLAERLITVNPPEKKVRFASEVVVHIFEKEKATSEEQETIPPQPIVGRASEGDPAVKKFNAILLKIGDQMRAGNVFRALVVIEKLRAVSEQRMPQHSQKLEELKEKLILRAQEAVAKLEDSEEISHSEAELLSDALEVMAAGNVPLEHSKLRVKFWENQETGQKLQALLAQNFARKVETPSKIVGNAQPPKQSPEERVFQETVSEQTSRIPVSPPIKALPKGLPAKLPPLEGPPSEPLKAIYDKLVDFRWAIRDSDDNIQVPDVMQIVRDMKATLDEIDLSKNPIELLKQLEHDLSAVANGGMDHMNFKNLQPMQVEGNQRRALSLANEVRNLRLRIEHGAGAKAEAVHSHQRDAVAQSPMADITIQSYKPVDVPKGLSEIIIAMGTEKKEALSPEHIMLGYKRAVSTEELFGAIRNAINDQDIPMKQKQALVDFTRQWVECGLFENELEEMKEPLTTILIDARTLAEESMDEDGKNLATATNLLSKVIKPIDEETIQAEVEKKGPTKTVTHTDFMSKVKKGRYKQQDVKDYAANLSNNVLGLLDQAKMGEMFVPNTKANFSKDAPHLSQALNFQMKVTDYVQLEILNTTNSKERTNLFEFYSRVSREIWESGDIGTASALATALASSDIEKTMKPEFGVRKLSDEAKFPNDLASDLIMASSYARRVNELRENGTAIIEPLTKMWGLYAMADEMDTRFEDGTINFQKIWSMAKIVSVIHDYKAKPPLNVKSNISGLIDEINSAGHLDDKELYALYKKNFPK